MKRMSRGKQAGCEGRSGIQKINITSLKKPLLFLFTYPSFTVSFTSFGVSDVTGQHTCVGCRRRNVKHGKAYDVLDECAILSSLRVSGHTIL